MSLINYGKMIDFYRETLVIFKIGTNIYKCFIYVVAKWS